jgi:hypothetical protein
MRTNREVWILDIEVGAQRRRYRRRDLGLQVRDNRCICARRDAVKVPLNRQWLGVGCQRRRLHSIGAGCTNGMGVVQR